jgi:isocitrate dehydrogenase
VLREGSRSEAGEVVDATACTSRAPTSSSEQIARDKSEGVLFSVHLKGDDDEGLRPDPVRSRSPGVPARGLRQYGDTLAAAGLSPNNGLGGILAGLDALPEGPEIKQAIEQGPGRRSALAMVDSNRGITNLHVPSDVIVDASMPAMIRTSGTCGARTARSTTPWRSFPTRATPGSTRW